MILAWMLYRNTNFFVQRLMNILIYDRGIHTQTFSHTYIKAHIHVSKYLILATAIYCTE